MTKEDNLRLANSSQQEYNINAKKETETTSPNKHCTSRTKLTIFTKLRQKSVRHTLTCALRVPVTAHAVGHSDSGRLSHSPVIRRQAGSSKGK
ncbi:hypothetical protein L6452_30741 [Arctium lappa]|uniref:Uncharacterized protein n=1 Tax=Arctium lappa TaxID=4217 RepID=A0ACB8ZJY8_ARCLA|nr:hypothetical protein L6452_30741 [Arctium lappa]